MSKVFRPPRSSKRSHAKLEKGLRRIVDANLNRALEGLRVCEEFCRFVIENKTLTADFKKLRHALICSLRNFDLKTEDLIDSRDILKDAGRKSTASEMNRRGISHVILANLQRIKESLRVLEEYLKIYFDTESIKKIRYSLYELEKKIIKAL